MRYLFTFLIGFAVALFLVMNAEPPSPNDFTLEAFGTLYKCEKSNE